MQNNIREYILLKLSKFPRLLYGIKSTYRFILLVLYGSKYARKFFLIDNKRLIYVNTPKVASSSIKASLIKNNNILETDESIHTIIEKKVEVRRKIPKELDYYKFAFVRNPYSRLVSCYENKICNSNKKNRKSNHFITYLFGYVGNSKNFNDFIIRVCRIPHRLAEPHFLSQYYLLFDKDKPVVDFIGKFENINEEFAVIQEKYELKPLRHFNKASKMNWMDYYTLETAELVYKKYKKDFEILGYVNEYEELISYLKEKEININNV